jgi:hypothetical protein
MKFVRWEREYVSVSARPQANCGGGRHFSVIRVATCRLRVMDPARISGRGAVDAGILCSCSQSRLSELSRRLSSMSSQVPVQDPLSAGPTTASFLRMMTMDSADSVQNLIA